MFDPTRTDEAMVSRKFVSQFHKGVGDTVVVDLPTRRSCRPGGLGSGWRIHRPRLTARIVGVGSSPWFSDQPGRKGGVVLSPDMVARYPANTMGDPHDPKNTVYNNAIVRLRVARRQYRSCART